MEGRGAGENGDAQPPKSVVYVVLASEVPLRVDWCTSWLLGWSSLGWMGWVLGPG